MKKNRQLLILCGVLVLALLLIRAARKEGERPSMAEAAGIVTLLPEGFSASSVQAVELATKGGDPIRLEKKGSDWVMTSAWNAPAQTAKIDTFLTDLASLEGEVASRSADGYADYGVDDAQAMTVKLFGADAAKPLATLFVGKTRGWENSFVRRDGDGNVYEAGKNLRQDAGLYGEDLAQELKRAPWLKTELLVADKAKMANVRLIGSDHELVFAKHAKEVEVETPPAKEGEEPKKEKKTEYTWELERVGDANFSQSKLDGILEVLASVKIDDVADPAQLEKRGEPNFRCEVKMDEGAEGGFVLLGYRAPGEKTLLKVDGQEQLYTLSDWNFEKIFVSAYELLEMKREEVKAADLRGLKLSWGSSVVAATRADDKAEWAATAAKDTEYKAAPVGEIAKKLESWKPFDISEQDAQETGLTAPRATLEVATADNKKIQLKLGAEHPAIRGAYVSLGDKVYVAKDDDVTKLFPAYDKVMVPVKKEEPAAAEAGKDGAKADAKPAATTDAVATPAAPAAAAEEPAKGATKKTKKTK